MINAGKIVDSQILSWRMKKMSNDHEDTFTDDENKVNITFTVLTGYKGLVGQSNNKRKTELRA